MMRVVDERYRMAFLREHLGAERIRLSKRETQTLQRALALLESLRDRRAEEYLARGYGSDVDMACDYADADDDYTLASACAHLSELFVLGEKAGGGSLALDLPVDVSDG